MDNLYVYENIIPIRACLTPCCSRSEQWNHQAAEVMAQNDHKVGEKKISKTMEIREMIMHVRKEVQQGKKVDCQDYIDQF